jgi:sigma-E factor negative regulatory protein RseC
MTQIATVKEILKDGYVTISVPRKSACGHDCEQCAGCGVQAGAVETTARDPVGVQIGQKVVVESSTGKLLGVVALVYMLPIVFFLLGYFLTYSLSSETVRCLIAVAAAALAMVPIVMYDRYAKRHQELTYTIQRVF